MSKKIQPYYPDFFLLNIYFWCSHNEYKTQIKKGGSPYSFHCKLQMIILFEGTGKSFKKNTFLAG